MRPRSASTAGSAGTSRRVTQGAIQKLCRTGQVRVDGKRAEAATRLAAGPGGARAAAAGRPRAATAAQAGRLTRPSQRELERMVLYRDEQLIVLNKPHGLPVQGGPGITRHLDGMLDGLRFGQPAPARGSCIGWTATRRACCVLARTPGRRRQARRRVPRPGRGEDLLGGRRRAAGAGRGPHRPAARENRRRARRAHRARRAGRHRRAARHHRLPYARPCRRRSWPGSSCNRHGPHASAPRALRRAGRADRRRPQIPRARPERRPVRRRRRAVEQAAPARARAGPAASGRRPAIVEAELPPHMRQTFKTLGFHAKPARPAVRK